MKKITTALFFMFLLLLFPSDIYAQEFFVDAIFNYKVDEEGKTTAKIDISIENATSEKYAKLYNLNLHNFEPTNVEIRENGNILEFTEKRIEGNSILEIEFEEPVAGFGKKQEFNVTFDSYNLAEKIGDTWEISLPKLDPKAQFRNYETQIEIPDKLGEEAFLSPSPTEKIKKDQSTVYIYKKDKIVNQGINLAFGKFQVYSFKINYHLENTENNNSQVKLAIPPDTAYQTIYFTEITPQPLDIVKDPDGNWIATYILEPRQRLDVNTEGYAKIYAYPRKSLSRSNPANIIANTKATHNWQSDDPKIKELAQKLKTPEAIFNFVVSTLTYNYERVKPDAERLGAKKALEMPDQALCMEFTDLFIALSRAAGIPAREVNGYAYSNNIKIQPLSLVADVLHSWPEYWDTEQGIWIPVDPTWQSTTGGKDYFSRFDLNHFAFVVHGINDNIPYPPGSYKLGPNPQKDIYIELSELPFIEEKAPQILHITNFSKFWTNSNIEISIQNNNSFALYDQIAYLYQNGKIIDQINIPEILPHSAYVFNKEINIGLLAINAPKDLKLILGNSETLLNTHYNLVLFYHLLSILTFIGIIILIVIVKVKPNRELSLKSLFVFPKLNLNDKINRFRNRREPIFQYEEQIQKDKVQQRKS